MNYWEDPEYWKTFEYDRQHGCLCYGGPNRYSWGWVVDDFGNAVIPSSQVTGFGTFEARHLLH